MLLFEQSAEAIIWCQTHLYLACISRKSLLAQFQQRYWMKPNSVFLDLEKL